jgi:hypothetical protein
MELLTPNKEKTVSASSQQYYVKFMPGFKMGWTFFGSMYLVVHFLSPFSPMLVLSPTHAWDETPNEGKSGDNPITNQY